MTNDSFNTTNLLGKTLRITYSYDTKEFSLFDSLGQLVKIDVDGRKLTKFAWSFSPRVLVSDYDLKLTDT